MDETQPQGKGNHLAEPRRGCCCSSSSSSLSSSMKQPLITLAIYVLPPSQSSEIPIQETIAIQCHPTSNVSSRHGENISRLHVAALKRHTQQVWRTVDRSSFGAQVRRQMSAFTSFRQGSVLLHARTKGRKDDMVCAHGVVPPSHNYLSSPGPHRQGRPGYPHSNKHTMLGGSVWSINPKHHAIIFRFGAASVSLRCLSQFRLVLACFDVVT